MEKARDRLLELITLANKYRDAYYNNNESLITDKEYDDLYDEIVTLEAQTGLILSNSPTQSVGYEIRSKLEKVVHAFPPMLSLDKTKELDKIEKFLNDKYGLVMAKMDGLTCRLTYLHGELVRAETRGNGIEGEDITHNAPVIAGIPLRIPNMPGELRIDGEIIVTKNDFKVLKAKFLDEKGKTYKNPRNYASGSARLKSNKECADRKLQFIAWKFANGYHFKHFASNLLELRDFGFIVTPFYELKPGWNPELTEKYIENIQAVCVERSYPIDGCVFSYDELAYMEQFDYTAHHWKAQMAYKFYDDTYETIIHDIRWTIGKTGVLTPTALFDTVEIDGTEVQKASVHNLTILKNLNVRKECTAHVFKANMIIPQIESCEDDGIGDFEIPEECPYCGAPTKIVKDKDSEVLKCCDKQCKGVVLAKLVTFVSKQGMNIDGLSKGILKILIDRCIIEEFTDIYKLDFYEEELKSLPGFGETSVTKLLESIDKSRNVTMAHFLTALSIDNLGYTSAKALCAHFDYSIGKFLLAINNGYDFSSIEGFGDSANRDIYNWFSDDYNVMQFEELLDMHITILPEILEIEFKVESPMANKTFCITGTFDRGPRSQIQKYIEGFGGVCVSSVTKKTDVLFCGKNAGSKLDKAHSLGIPVIIEDELDAYLTGEVDA